MLSQINAARGDDAMAVDDDSSSESSDEVINPHANQLYADMILSSRKKNSIPLDQWNSLKHVDIWPSIPYLGWKFSRV